jgi:hypothetical protein
MGKNTGTGARIGIVKNRTQSYNPKTGLYVKRDDTTGKILSCKKTPYKAIRNTGKNKLATSSNNTKTC